MLGGRFWALALDEEEESTSEEEGEAGSHGSYFDLCCTPSPCSGRSLVETSSRSSKRETKRRLQRLGARDHMAMEVKDKVALTGRRTNFRVPKLPVLEPTVREAGVHDLEGWTEVLRRRRRPPPATRAKVRGS